MLLICPNLVSGVCPKGSHHCTHAQAHTHSERCDKETTCPGKCIPFGETKENKMDEIKIGYKVVKNDDGKLVSASVGSGKVVYAKDITVKPRMWGGPLTVFSSKYRAIGFIAELGDGTRDLCSVFKCEYVPTKAQSVWRLKDLMVNSKNLSELPTGTTLAKSVTLKEKIFGA